MIEQAKTRPAKTHGAEDQRPLAHPDDASAQNPFFAPWETPFGLPPFDRIAPEHFPAAFERAMAQQRAEIDAIAANADAPSFENTVAAIERSGQDLKRTAATFFNLAGAHTNDALQAVERAVVPMLAKHRSAIFLNEALFGRIADLDRRQEALDLTPEQARVLERYRIIFTRAGAPLGPDAKMRLAEISERLATLGTQFSQNVLADEKAYALLLDGEADLAGLPEFVRQAARRAAEDRGHPDKHVITLARSSIGPFLQFSSRRDLREQAFRAWAARGESEGVTDNRPIIAEMVRLRLERANRLGYETFAHFKLADTMAKTPEAALDLLRKVWEPARARAVRERDDLQALAQAEGQNLEIAPWDWRFYAEKLRRARHDLNEAEIKPYLQLDRMIAAAFETARRLFGLSFEEVHGLSLYHPDVRAWTVTGREGEPIGLFLADYFARPSKRSGAWMSSFRMQEKLAGDIRPVIVNVMNFSKAAEGEPALLSFDDARTLFHEFGHALHGLLSDVTYPLLAGTNVPTDFVELPSQLYEHWLSRPEILGEFALHEQTGEPMPEALIERLLAARNFDQGFATVEYTASALVDLDFHLLESADDLDAATFERAALARIGMPPGIVMRHRPPHFTHVFSGDGYAAGYYSYLWSEVLDADAFDAFQEVGDVFDPATAERLKTFVYSAGSLQDPAEAYRAFRGRMPSLEPLLNKRGLGEAA